MKDNIKEIFVYNPHLNNEVTSFYIKMICEVFIDLNYKIKTCNLLEKNRENHNRILIVIDLKDVVIAKKCEYKNIIYWIQGVAPEEIYLKNKDILRYLLYTYREYRALKASSFIFYCSGEMKEHYEKKYRFYFDNYYIMPCFNEEIHMEVITKKKYERNDFVYVGSMEKWQNFEGTVKYYKKIEERVKNTRFKVFVKEQEEAKKILDKFKVKNYIINYVSQEQLSYEITQAKFGFCLRENNTVNNVATPTKLSNYIANGVFPIYSKCLQSFHDYAQKSKFCFCADDDHILDIITDTCNKTINGDNVYDDYKHIFGNYYSSEYHKANIKNALLKLSIKN